MNESITDEFIELAVELIDDCIEEPNAVWISIENDIQDPECPGRVTRGNCEEYDVRIVFDLDRLEDRQFLKYRKGRTTNNGQVNAIMYQTEFEPKLKDIVIRQGQELTVNNVDPIQPADAPIIYLMELGS